MILRSIKVLIILLLISEVVICQNRAFVNSGFEAPYTISTSSWTDGYAQNSVTPPPNVAEWYTTAPDHEIEIWSSGWNGVPAVGGNQFVELNANYVSRLYQYICLNNGDVMNWSFFHRGRLGVDVMEFNIYNQAGTTKLVTIATASDGNTNWVNYSGSYTSTLPSGIYQFSAESISAAGGDQTQGNLLDEINIGLGPLVEFASATSAGVVTLGNNLPQLKINGTVPPGGSVVTLAVVSSGTSAISGTDYLLTTTVNIPAGLYNTNSPGITIPLTILYNGLGLPNTNIQLRIVGATNTMIVGNSDCNGISQTTTTYTIINTVCTPGNDTLKVNIGNDLNLCNPISTTLVTGYAVPPSKVTWYRNGSTISGANGSNYFVNAAGLYFATVSVPGCVVATSNGVNITSSAASPNNAIFCGTSTVNLSVSPANSGKYKWWSDPTATTSSFLIQKGGSSINLAVTGTANFVVYAQDTSITKLNTGPTLCPGLNYSGWSESNTNDAFYFNVNTNFILDSITVPIVGPSSGTFNFIVNIINSYNATTTINVTLNGVGNAYYKIPIGGLTLSSGVGYKMNFVGSNKNVGLCPYGTSPYPLTYSPYFSITNNNAPSSWNSYNLVGISNWVIRTGTICSRIPVVAYNSCPLAIAQIELFALRNNSVDQLSWQYFDMNFSSYTLQRASDGINFYDLISFGAEQNNVRTYTVSNTGFPSAYYRIRVVDSENRQSFSNIKYFNGNEANINFSLFPNPTKGDVTLQSNNSTSDKLNVQLNNTLGQTIFSSWYEMDPTTFSTILPTASLSKGVYFMKVSTTTQEKIIKLILD